MIVVKLPAAILATLYIGNGVLLHECYAYYITVFQRSVIRNADAFAAIRCCSERNRLRSGDTIANVFGSHRLSVAKVAAVKT